MKKLTLLICAFTMMLAGFAAPVLAFDDVTPAQAYEMASTNPNVYILDVRTDSEWTWVGHPGVNAVGDGAGLEGKVVNISYEIEVKGNLVVNPCFLKDVDEVFEGNPDLVLITMCRSGGRSVAAANLLEPAGYQVLNMVTGFEGGKDTFGYRTVSGWKVDGMPYNFSGAGYLPHQPRHPSHNRR
jgi:rhodanese-related sulfurtransferase